MGKVDDLRALREARYAASQKGAAPVKKAEVAKKALAKAVAAPVAPDALCGHRSIGNKVCIREEGHVATGTKSHRYAKG